VWVVVTGDFKFFDLMGRDFLMILWIRMVCSGGVGLVGLF